VVDYFSSFVEVNELRKNNSEEVIQFLKSIFARHGIPDQLVSDNGPHFQSRLFELFEE